METIIPELSDLFSFITGRPRFHGCDTLKHLVDLCQSALRTELRELAETKTSYELWHRKALELRFLRDFGPDEIATCYDAVMGFKSEADELGLDMTAKEVRTDGCFLQREYYLTNEADMNVSEAFKRVLPSFVDNVSLISQRLAHLEHSELSRNAEALRELDANVRAYQEAHEKGVLKVFDVLQEQMRHVTNTYKDYVVQLERIIHQYSQYDGFGLQDFQRLGREMRETLDRQQEIARMIAEIKSQ